MSNAVLLYDTIIKFADDCGWLMVYRGLYDDLTNGCPPSPESYKVLVRHHEGNLDVLRDKLSYARKTRLLTWETLRKLMEKNEIYDSDSAEVFVLMLMRRNEDSDFRAKVRDWSRAELRNIKAGKPEKLMSFQDFIDRYEQLLLRRQKKNPTSNAPE